MPLAKVAEHQQGLFVGDLAVVKAHVVEHGAVQLQDVDPAVVVVVDELGRDPAKQPRLGADSGAIRGIGEGAVSVVVVEAVELEVEMGDVDIEQAVAVDVGGVDAHAGLVAAVLACGQPGDQRHILEGAVAIVEEEEVGPGVVGDGDVGPSVVVEVGEHHAHAFRFGQADTRLVAHVGEGAVVVVVV